jgi:hypothetical protein
MRYELNDDHNGEPERRWEGWRWTAPAAASLPFRATHESRLEELKERLLRESLGECAEAEYLAPLRRAANEAASLAWASQQPLLVFPELFNEIAAQARRQYSRQAGIRRRSAVMAHRAA